METRALAQLRRGLRSQGGLLLEGCPENQVPPGPFTPGTSPLPAAIPPRWGEPRRAGRGPTRKALRVWWALSASSRLPRCISRCSLTRSSCWALGRGRGRTLRAGAEAGPALGRGRACVRAVSSEPGAPGGGQGATPLGLSPASRAIIVASSVNGSTKAAPRPGLGHGAGTYRCCTDACAPSGGCGGRLVLSPCGHGLLLCHSGPRTSGREREAAGEGLRGRSGT